MGRVPFRSRNQMVEFSIILAVSCEREKQILETGRVCAENIRGASQARRGQKRSRENMAPRFSRYNRKTVTTVKAHGDSTAHGRRNGWPRRITDQRIWEAAPIQMQSVAFDCMSCVCSGRHSPNPFLIQSVSM